MQLALQPSDHDAIGGLPVKWRTLVNQRIVVMKHFSEGKLSKLDAMSSLGVSRATFDRLVSKVKDMGWAALVPMYKGVGAKNEGGLCAEFLEFWKMLVEKRQRKTAGAYKQLVMIWKARRPFEIDGVEYAHIPGYAGWPGWPNLPEGWGGKGRNLYRHQPKKLALTAMRHGLGRARQLYGPKVLSTRVGLWHMSHVMFDDVKLDVKGRLLDTKKLVVPLQLGALELLSGSRFAHGTKPQLYRADGTKEGLTEAEMRFLLCVVLRYGISKRGTTFVVEHGTAAIRKIVRDILQRAFGDLVIVKDSGMLGDVQAIAGMGDGRGGRGNPNHKAALESLHSYIHNQLDFLPAQTGHHRDAPEFLGVLERDNEQMFKLAQRLPPEARALLKHRTPEFHTQLMPLVNAVLDAVNKREDHNLEGWAELGFITQQYRLLPESNEWVDEHRLELMPPMARQAYLAMADADARCWQPKRMSPHEVFQMGCTKRDELVQVPDSVIAEILYQDIAEPRRLGDDGVFGIQNIDIAPAKMWFEGTVTTPAGREMALTWGETYDTVLNPFDRSVLWIFSATKQRGAFLGTARAVQRHCRADDDAARDKFKRSAHLLSEQLAGPRSRHAATTQAEIDRLKHNRRVLQDHEQAQRELTNGASRALETIFSTQTPPTTHDHETNDDPRDLWR